IRGSACWESWALPMPPEKISCIEGYADGEGLEYAMRDNLDILRKADFVFVYTDAQIGDAPIRKEEFHRVAVYTWGLYAGTQSDPYVQAALQKFFDKAIIRPSALELVDAMLTQL